MMSRTPPAVGVQSTSRGRSAGSLQIREGSASVDEEREIKERPSGDDRSKMGLGHEAFSAF